MSEKKRYRSAEWYNSKTHKRDTFVHRGWMRNQGHPSHLFDGRPVIGICNTWSELTPCNGHFREIADSVKKGVYEAGGLRDFSRIAASNEIMWRDIFFDNKVNVVKAIDLFTKNLNAFKKDINSKNNKSILKKLIQTKKEISGNT